ncbi:MAG: TetR/AcrR family transcriptional regulator [Bacteroidales bacterium]|nr:TetR/AcrR family transcriptional regulator [Bacteroidales bacterium]MBN2820815.1 TetR/AcrR family transcriptional regulator [Bacteroidales bacterium]
MIEKRAIISQTGDLFKKYGIKSITMDDISRAMGVSKKTIYQHIPDKTELVQLVVEQELNQLKDKLNKAKDSSDDPIHQFVQYTKVMNEFSHDYSYVIEYDLNKYYPQIFSFIKEKYIVLLIDTVVENIIFGKKTGVYRKDIDEKIFAKIHVSNAKHFSDDQILTKEEHCSPVYLNEVCRLHLKGLLTDKWESKIEKYLTKPN